MLKKTSKSLFVNLYRLQYCVKHSNRRFIFMFLSELCNIVQWRWKYARFVSDLTATGKDYYTMETESAMKTYPCAELWNSLLLFRFIFSIDMKILKHFSTTTLFISLSVFISLVLNIYDLVSWPITCYIAVPSSQINWTNSKTICHNAKWHKKWALIVPTKIVQKRFFNPLPLLCMQWHLKISGAFV